MYANFNVIYYDFDWRKYFDDYAAEGNDPADLIEAVDGFHPSTAGGMLLAKNFIDALESEGALGDVNPNNDVIIEMFGK